VSEDRRIKKIGQNTEGHIGLWAVWNLKREEREGKLIKKSQGAETEPGAESKEHGLPKANVHIDPASNEEGPWRKYAVAAANALK